VRGGDLTPITTDVRKPHVIHHDEDDVGPVVRSEDQEAGKGKGKSGEQGFHMGGGARST
jgi:hypothetical protein